MSHPHRIRTPRAALTALVLLPALILSTARAQSAASERHDLMVGDATLVLLTVPQASPPAAVLSEWAQRAARIVAHYYGRFPVREVHIVFAPVPGERVAGGTTFGEPQPLIRLRVGTQVDMGVLANDWVLVHEMTHLALPEVGDDHAWLAEGLAVYVEGVARVQAGDRTIEDVFAEEERSMPRGMAGPQDRGLDHDHSWGRTYWGGALFCLLADVQIRQRTHNRYGLREAMQAVLKASGGLPAHWDINRVFAVGDAAVGVPALRDLYRQMKDRPYSTDLPALWRSLGVEKDGEAIRINDEAPLAAIRRAIFSPG